MISVKEFGKTPEGRVIKAFTLTNENGIEAVLIEKGAVLQSLFVPDKDGNKADVVLGYDNLEPYLKNGFFFGAIVGRNANRIENAKIEIDGKVYELQDNDSGNNLHTHHERGFHVRDWEGKAEEGSNSVIFYLEEEDLYTGFPGKVEITVTYTLTKDNELMISYHAVSDKNTVLNCTNHSYFNLAGHDSGTITDHIIQINSDRFVAIKPGGIPTGELKNVEGTPFDLRKPIRISEHIDDDDDQLKAIGGYDHCFEIQGDSHKFRFAASAWDEKTGRKLEVFTDLPGVQFYCGNFLDGEIGKGGTSYKKRSAFCLESNYYPNCVGEKNFESPIFGPDKEYNTTTVYKFSTI